MQMANGLALDGLARDPEVIRAYTNDPLVHNKISVRLALETLQAGEWALAHAAEFPLPSAAGTRHRRYTHIGHGDGGIRRESAGRLHAETVGRLLPRDAQRTGEG